MDLTDGWWYFCCFSGGVTIWRDATNMGLSIKAIGATASVFLIFECSSRPIAVTSIVLDLSLVVGNESTPSTVAFVLIEGRHLHLRRALFGGAFCFKLQGRLDLRRPAWRQIYWDSPIVEVDLRSLI